MSTSSNARKSLTELLTKMIDIGASDLHLRVDSAPQVRVHGKLHPLEGYAALGPRSRRKLATSFLTEAQAKHFENIRSWISRSVSKASRVSRQHF
jgi:Tfp pilus assembly pilus retraction ATPase PilT